MCGIAGVVRWGKEPIKEDIIGILLVDNEKRGNDASGLVIQQAAGSLNVLKKDVPGWKLVTSEEYTKFIKDYLKPDSRSVLVHARGASRGNPRDNNNNHPIHAGCSAVIHNGMLRNSDEMFNSLKLERKADTDTDIARAIFDKWGLTSEAIRKLSKASGSGAIAVVHPDYKDKLLLLRSGNPLTIASNEDFFFFSSEKTTLHKACRPFIERMGMWFQAQKPDVDFANMADNTGWIIGLNGLESHTKCNIAKGQHTEPWRRTYEEYEKRQEKWNTQAKAPGTDKDSKMKYAWCYKCQREWVIPLTAIFSQYTCDAANGGCGQSLWQIPEDRLPRVVPVSGKVN